MSPYTSQLNAVRFTLNLQQLLSGGGSILHVIPNRQQQTISLECLVLTPSLPITNISYQTVYSDSVVSQRAILTRDIEVSNLGYSPSKHTS